MDEMLLTGPGVRSLAWTLIHFIWQGTVIGAATAVVLRVLAGASPAARYAVACIGFALLLAAPALTGIWSYEQLAASEVSRTGLEPMPLPELPAAAYAAAVSAAGGDASRVSRVERLLPGAVTVWLAGVAVLSLRLLAAWLGVARLTRQAALTASRDLSARVAELSRRLLLRRTVRVLESTIVTVPAVVGWLRPAILMPASVLAGLPTAHLDAILAHELAHIRRHDYLVNAVQALGETLLFYHPAVWWCSRQMRVEREHCCDDIAVAICGDRLMYATALTRLEELRVPAAALALSATGGRLVDRVRRVLGAPPHKDASRGWMTVATLALLVTVATGGILVRGAEAGTPLLMQWRALVDPPPLPPPPPPAPAPPLPLMPAAPPEPPPPPEPEPPSGPRPFAADEPPALVPSPPPAPPAFQAPPAIPPPPAPPPPPALPFSVRVDRPVADDVPDNVTLMWSDRSKVVTLRHRGRFVFSDDDTEIVAIEPGGFFIVSEESRRLPSFLPDWVARRRVLELRGRDDGSIERRFTAHGREWVYEPDGRDWARQILPEVARRAPQVAEARIVRILEASGVAGVVAEIPRPGSDFIRSHYLTLLVDRRTLTPAELAAVMAATRTIGSDGDHANALIHIADRQSMTAPVLDAFFDAVDSLRSDGEHRRVLTHLVRKPDASPEVVAGVIRSVRGIRSDGEAATVLLAVAEHARSGPLRDAYVATAEAISSSGERRRAMTALGMPPLASGAR